MGMGEGPILREAWKAFYWQGLACTAKQIKNALIGRRHINRTAVIMIPANYEMKVNFMPCIPRQKGSELFKFSSA